MFFSIYLLAELPKPCYISPDLKPCFRARQPIFFYQPLQNFPSPSRPLDMALPQWFRAVLIWVRMFPQLSPNFLSSRAAVHLHSSVPTITDSDIAGHRLHDLQSHKRARSPFCLASVPWQHYIYIWIRWERYLQTGSRLVFYFLSTTALPICIGLGIAISDWLKLFKEAAGEMNRTGTTGVALSLQAQSASWYLFLHLGIFIIFNPANNHRWSRLLAAPFP